MRMAFWDSTSKPDRKSLNALDLHFAGPWSTYFARAADPAPLSRGVSTTASWKFSDAPFVSLSTWLRISRQTEQNVRPTFLDPETCSTWPIASPGLNPEWSRKCAACCCQFSLPAMMTALLDLMLNLTPMALLALRLDHSCNRGADGRSTQHGHHGRK